MKIQPKTDDEHAMVQSIAGMRYRIDEFSLHDGLTRAALDSARLRGFNEYETMVLLAYAALCGRESVQDALLEHMTLCIKPLTMVVPMSKARGDGDGNP